MILAQQTVTAGQTYQVNAPDGLVDFDIHNDSPYNVGISFSGNSGITGADYYMSPHSILYGISPGTKHYSIGSARSNQPIYLFTQTPIGGASQLGNAPANCVTIIGYPQGWTPQASVSMNRMNNLGNSAPLSTAATSVQNDGSAAGTSLIESTVTGQASSSVSVSVDGIVKIAAVLAGALTTLIQTQASGNPLLLGAAAQIAEVLGGLQVDGTSSFTGQMTAAGGIITSNIGQTGLGDVISANPTNTHVKGGGAILFEVPGGTLLASVNSSGLRINNGLLYGTDVSNSIVSASGTSGTGNTRIQNTDQINLQVPGGTNVITITSTGVTINQQLGMNSNVVLKSSAINKITNNNICAAAHFSGTATSAGTVINHGFSNTTPNYVGTSISGSTFSYTSVGSITSTQCTCYCGASLPINGFATWV